MFLFLYLWVLLHLSRGAQSSQLPTPISIDQGELTCKSKIFKHLDFGDEKVFASLEDMNRAVDESCESMALEKVDLASTTFHRWPPSNVTVEVRYTGGDGCPEALNFGPGGLSVPVEIPITQIQQCKERLKNVVDGCDTESNGQKYWKAGGWFYRDCTTWTLEKHIK